MDKSVVNQLVATVGALRAAGETGFWVLIIVLLVFIGVGVAALVYQRIVIGRFKTTAKTTEELLAGVKTNIEVIGTNIKLVEASIRERELGIKERDGIQERPHPAVLCRQRRQRRCRAELSRLRDQQKGLKESINNSITEGLQDIQTAVPDIYQRNHSTGSQLVREELWPAVEFEATLRRSVERLAEQLNDSNKL